LIEISQAVVNFNVILIFYRNDVYCTLCPIRECSDIIRCLNGEEGFAQAVTIPTYGVSLFH